MGEQQQHRARRRAAEKMVKQLERCAVGPLQVVEDEHERPPGRQHPEQVRDRPVAAKPLLGERARQHSRRRPAPGTRAPAADGARRSARRVPERRARRDTDRARRRRRRTAARAQARPPGPRRPALGGPTARSPSAASNRDLPIPGSPETAHAPALARQPGRPSARSSTASSASLPTHGARTLTCKCPGRGAGVKRGVAGKVEGVSPDLRPPVRPYRHEVTVRGVGGNLSVLAEAGQRIETIAGIAKMTTVKVFGRMNIRPPSGAPHRRSRAARLPPRAVAGLSRRAGRATGSARTC